MTDIWLPSWLDIARASISYRDSTAVSRNPYNGQIRTASLGGDKLGASIEFTPQGGASTQMERAALMSFLSQMRGRQNRIFLTDTSYRRRGSFPTSELLTNNTFANGTSGWTASSLVSISASDRALRLSRSSNNGADAGYVHQSGISLSQYVPYAVRGGTRPGRNSGVMYPLVGAGTTLGSSVNGGNASSSAFGMITAAFVAMSASSYSVRISDASAIGPIPGDYFDLGYASLSRCAMADGGGNLMLRSDALQSVPWTVGGCTINSNQQTAPDGSVTADRIVEDGTSGSHYAQQAISVAGAEGDYCQYAFVQPFNRTACWLTLNHSGGNLTAYFTLTAGGSVFSILAGTGWSNPRASIEAIGGGWYRIYLLGRKTGAQTTINAQFGLANPTGTSVYTGTNGLSALDLWRCGVSQSALPVRPVQSVASAVAAESQRGGGIYLKGLPPSTNGLLQLNDQFEVITSLGSELKIASAPLDSDGAGLGYLKFDPPLRGQLADNAAVIVHQPMGRFIFTGDYPQWLTEPGLISTASLELEEA